MPNMLKRMIALSLVLIMALTLVACAAEKLPVTSETTKKKPTIQTTPPKETEPPLQAAYWVDLVVNGTAQYSVVAARSEYAEIAETLAESLTNKTGVYFSFSPKDNVPGKKILVGSKPDTVLQNVADLTYNGQVAMYSESIIYVTGYHEDAVQRAASRFQSNILEDYITENEDGKVRVSVPDYAFFFYNPDNYSNTSPVLFGHDLSEYKIVVSSKMEGFEPRMMDHLIDAIGCETGYLMKYVTDATNASAKEIVVGLTTRPDSIALQNSLEPGTYAIKSVGESIYVVYDNYLVAGDAMTKLRSLYNNHTGEAINLVEKPDYEEALVQKKDASHVRVMTTNIVAAGDLDSLEYLGDRYGITWEERVRIQASMIMTYLPDFIGLQEMQEGTVNGITGYMHTELKKATEEEYSFVTYSGLANNAYWTPIMYRSTVWQIEDKGYGQSWDSAMHRWQWALFSKIDNPDEKYILVNLHNPTGNNPSWQQTAASDLNGTLLDLEYQYGVPIFVTGDFNTEYNSPIYKAMVQDIDLKTSYKLTDDVGKKTASIDHVLAQESLVNVEAYRVIDNGYIYMTSDHRPVFADVSVKQ